MNVEELKALLAHATSGPWVACEGVVRTPDGALVSYANGNASGWLDDNARLIAAAPDLAVRVIELEEALEDILGVGFDAPMTWTGTDAEWERTRANIMQAEARAALSQDSDPNTAALAAG